VALNLYRRHRKQCEAGRPNDTRSGEFEERKKAWKRCACPIYASGTLAGKFYRKETQQSTWDEARAIAAQWEAAGSWSVDPLPTFTESVENLPERVRIADATEAYLARCQTRGLTDSSLSKYRTSIKQLRAYCDSRGCVMLDQLTIADMDRFYASWKDGKRAGAKKLERLKSFVKFCLKRKWMAEDITEDLLPQEGSSIPANKTPFTDEELDRIYKACDQIGGPTPPGPGHRDWGGEDIKDFIYLSIYTGLRISDVATFDVTKRLNGNNVFLRMHKTRRELYTWIPDWLVARLREREKKHGGLIFRTGQSLQMRTMTELWRLKLAKAFELAGPFLEKPIPHRLRHTFVRILLQNGVSTADAAVLIGDTEQVLLRHYGKWVTERQDRLSSILQKAFSEKSKPADKVVAIR